MKRIFISLVMALALVSCSTEELSIGGNGSQKGKVQLVLSTDGFEEIGSRAVDESAIHDLNILEYVKGEIVPIIVYLDKDNGVDFSKAVEVRGLKDITATTLDANGNMNESTVQNFIFVVANYGEKINSEDVADLNALKNFKMKFTGKKDLEYLPMTGFYYGGIDANSTTEIHIRLQRAVAKIEFTLDTSSFMASGKKPSSIRVESIELCNVPGQITLYPCQDRPSLPAKDHTTVAWGGTPFPTKAEMEAEGGSVTYGDEQNLSSDDDNTDNIYTYEAYIPENARGSYTAITDDEDKRPSKCDTSISEKDEEDEDKEKSYTHFHVTLRYVDSAYGNNIMKKATYRIYLGGNETGDMNLLRNTRYIGNTEIQGANSSDTRITVEEIPFVDVEMTDNANCYMIDMSDVSDDYIGKNVTIPLQQVINGWNYIVTNSSSSITASDVQKILESGNWEIQTEWRTWKGSNITGIKSSGLKATLTIPSTVTNGNNAVVKLVSKADGKTYWSWHLWFTDYKPSATGNTVENGQVHQYISNAFKSGGIYYGKYMMDRNLGATITGVSGAISQPQTTEDAQKYYGLMYQWGRKDPFIGSNGKKSSSSSYSDFVLIYDGTTNESPSTGSTPFETGSATTSIVNSVYNPGTFYYGSSGNSYGWLNSSFKDDDLWGGNTAGTAKSVFDPCPPGWRVLLGGGTATNNPWAGFRDGSASSTSGGNSSWNGFGWKNAISGQTGTAGCLYSYNNCQAWYPATGCLNDGNGTLANFDGYGYCWSAASYKSLHFFNGFVDPARSYNRARGYPVRCVQE